MKRESSNWYSLCRHHLKQGFRKSKDAYASLDLDLRKKYRCGFKGCRRIPTVEYYPGLADVIKESEKDIRAGRVYTWDQVKKRFKKISRKEAARFRTTRSGVSE